ncbi:MAG: glycosyltransferase involved in cell wall biosynthesis [Crocinitomix sp.]|jgi:glycosyltransferase involved in cell wall biosynthesis
MTNLDLSASEKTPYFKLNDDGNFSFGGISMPEDAASFYFKIIDWLKDYYNNPKKETFVTVSFRYLNSSSSRMVLKMFQAFKGLQATGKTNVKCTWYYEEDDLDMRDYVHEVKKHADNIEFEILPTDEIETPK